MQNSRRLPFQETEVIRAVGEAADDDANLGALISDLNSKGGGIIAVDGQLSITSDHTITTPISFYGTAPDSALVFENNTGQIFYGQTGAPTTLNGTQIDISGVGAGHAAVEVPNPGNWDIGDWFFVYSNLPYSGVKPHFVGGEQHPGEFHQIRDIQGNELYFNDFIVDDMSSTGSYYTRINKIPMYEGVFFRDLKIINNSIDGGTGTNHYKILWRYHNGLQVENIHVKNQAAGGFFFGNCANVNVRNCIFAGQEHELNNYHIGIATCNGINISDNWFYGSRHQVTTGGTSGAEPNARLGVLRHCSVRNNKCAHTQTETGGSACLDSHPESYGMIFENNDIVTGVGTRPAILTRGRNTIIKGNVLDTGDWSETSLNNTDNQNAWAVEVWGENCQIKDNVIQNNIMGISLLESADGAKIMGNHFKNIDRGCVKANDDVLNNIEISNNYFDEKCSDGTWSSQGFPNPTLISIDSGSGHRIYNNIMRKGINTYSVHTNTLTSSDIEIKGNLITGYGYAKLGIDSASLNQSGIEEDYRLSNTTDVLGNFENSVVSGSGVDPEFATVADALNESTSNLPIKSTYYVNDGSGNVLYIR